MNFTLSEYMNAFQQTVENLPELMDKWDKLDNNLRELYEDEILWTTTVFNNIVQHARDSQQLHVAIRLLELRRQLNVLEPRIYKTMGITIPSWNLDFCQEKDEQSNKNCSV